MGSRRDAASLIFNLPGYGVIEAVDCAEAANAGIKIIKRAGRGPGSGALPRPVSAHDRAQRAALNPLTRWITTLKCEEPTN
jgi:hypothetical protein